MLRVLKSILPRRPAGILHSLPTRMRFCAGSKNIRVSPKMSELGAHLAEAQKYISLEQYHLADMEIERAGQLQPTKDEVVQLLRTRGELEMIRPNKDLRKAVGYFDQAIQEGGDFSLDCFRHKIVCLEEAGMLTDRLKTLGEAEALGMAALRDVAELAHILYLRKDYEKALEQYAQC